jgi:hypothetical protein
MSQINSSAFVATAGAIADRRLITSDSANSTARQHAAIVCPANMRPFGVTTKAAATGETIEFQQLVPGTVVEVSASVAAGIIANSVLDAAAGGQVVLAAGGVLLPLRAITLPTNNNDIFKAVVTA